MEHKSNTAPLYEALLAYRDSGQRSFHVPGHKNGQVYRGLLEQTDQQQLEGAAGEIHRNEGEAKGKQSWGRSVTDGEERFRQAEEKRHGNETDASAADVVPVSAFLEMMRLDVTEISGTDDLHHPEGVILEAQQLAADCFGAEESFFLVGGSTSGNLSLLLTVCNEPNSLVLVQRNVHKSVIHGLMLAGARAVFLEPWVDPASGLAVMPSLETVQAAVQAYPEAKGVLVTLPNYYGMGADLKPIAEVCHEAGMPLLVDEAHGAHYGQHPELPASALSCGADGVVQSTHKMLSAFTMGAMLHVQGPRLNRSLLRQRLAMVQSSSPSYPVMASLDLARRLLHTQGANAFTAGLAAVDAFKRGLAELPRFQLLQPGQLLQQEPPAGAKPATGGKSEAASAPGRPEALPAAALPSAAGYTAQDPFKAVIYDGTGVLSGYGLQQQLEACGCVPEMSDERYVVLLFSLGSTLRDAEHLLQALRQISLEQEQSQSLGEQSQRFTKDSANYISTWNNFQEGTPFSEPIPFTLQPIMEEDTTEVSIDKCVGLRSAEMVIPYPPGIPLVYAGEQISAAMISRIKLLRDEGARFHGVSDTSLQSLKIIRE
ncbi:MULTISPECIES: aminotransferase class I/II-fold pyridoxal phosphate-dependent enzyme [unclassified Paenibacillus]|uniref:aminotransferase class I/II-fold pyridoxal phosphate-dependent enzyme n=1 Tax=unclassified Paenibacillus TaxID=185978 RepID=UPI0009A793E1|nr:MULTISPECIES: aminotransferase class I/II-fold pyridoxal phosphate-dependent enzyme [unclassified Paenibacillus]SLK21978.1 Arginine/lysine/ornithine decarboxylase [Paenibacillus sp. RU5A]SOC76850.1 Arginine/lysine/ornithine decarboxylase [Paenibacillus sp. RU26A]SOC78177.1 Arginine/lysine/ornithine decarboxylase [Paenibacillus sp. RU5M]